METVDERNRLKDYRVVCAKLGAVMCVYFVCRIISGVLVDLISGLGNTIGNTPAYMIGYVVMIIMIYVIPILVTAIVFNSFSYYSRDNGGLRALYRKPRRLARAFGTFPAMYGFGYGTALLTLLVMFIVSRITGGQTLIEDLFRPTALEPSSSIVSALAMLFMLVVIAPVVEEIWVRGIMYDALKPYGNGIAIIISSVLFGLMHGSLYMLFYTTALGFALGYVRYATGSLFVVTILHAIINSISGCLLLLLSLVEITDGDSRLLNTVFTIYVLAILILIVVGIIAFITKIPAIKEYRIENGWDEIGPGKKTSLFLLSIPVIIMLILAINELANNWLRRLF